MQRSIKLQTVQLKFKEINTEPVYTFNLNLSTNMAEFTDIPGEIGTINSYTIENVFINESTNVKNLTLESFKIFVDTSGLTTSDSTYRYSVNVSSSSNFVTLLG